MTQMSEHKLIESQWRGQQGPTPSITPQYFGRDYAPHENHTVNAEAPNPRHLNYYQVAYAPENNVKLR